jgi:hypothetical protein
MYSLFWFLGAYRALIQGMSNIKLSEGERTASIEPEYMVRRISRSELESLAGIGGRVSAIDVGGLILGGAYPFPRTSMSSHATMWRPLKLSRRLGSSSQYHRRAYTGVYAGAVTTLVS